MTDLDFDRLDPIVKQISRSIGRHFLSYVSIPDIEQELWAHIMLKQTHVAGYLTHPEGMGAINTMLVRQAKYYCGQERAASLGIDPDDFAIYSPQVVRTLLADVFEYEDWQSFAMNYDKMPSGKRLEATTDRIAMLCDVKSAVEKLPERDYNIIIARFKYHYDDEALAEMLDIAISSVDTTVRRSVNRIAKSLSEPDISIEYVGTRKVRSNAAARAELSNLHDGN